MWTLSSTWGGMQNQSTGSPVSQAPGRASSGGWPSACHCAPHHPLPTLAASLEVVRWSGMGLGVRSPGTGRGKHWSVGWRPGKTRVAGGGGWGQRRVTPPSVIGQDSCHQPPPQSELSRLSVADPPWRTQGQGLVTQHLPAPGTTTGSPPHSPTSQPRPPDTQTGPGSVRPQALLVITHGGTGSRLGGDGPARQGQQVGMGAQLGLPGSGGGPVGTGGAASGSSPNTSLSSFCFPTPCMCLHGRPADARNESPGAASPSTWHPACSLNHPRRCTRAQGWELCTPTQPPCSEAGSFHPRAPDAGRGKGAEGAAVTKQSESVSS